MSSEKKGKKKSGKKKIGRVNPFLYALIHAFLKPYFTKKYSIEFDKECVRSIKGPSVVIATHTSDMDHVLSALTLYPIRPTYVVSEHFIRNPKTARLLKLMHIITKKMFTPDASTVINIMRAKRENAVLVIFPEGRLSCYGHSLPIADGTAELIKKLGVDLYIWKGCGAYLTFPKWREKKGERRGRIKASVKPLLSADEIKTKSLDEIGKITASAIAHDDELCMEGTEYRSSGIALGADKILFKCPICKNEGCISSNGDTISCTCGFSTRLDRFYRLSDAPFARINEWFEWQQDSIDTENERLCAKVRLGACADNGYMDENAGIGMAYLDKNVFSLSGTVHGRKLEFSSEPQKIGAFPITAGEHFDVYVKGELIYVYPLPDTRSSVKWVCFLDKLNNTQNRR